MRKLRKTTIDFIEQAKIIHDNKYDYSLTEYKGWDKKVKIICNIHGIFEQSAGKHLNKRGCPKCALDNASKLFRMNIDVFIDKCKKIHNNKYEYNDIYFKNLHEKITINCEKHGNFEQIAREHLKGCGCPICKESHGEKIVRNFLIENNIEFIYQKRFKECRYKNPLPFDFYLPEKNICIEYNGKQHYQVLDLFGGEIELKNRIMLDKLKSDFCIENKILLIVIKYNENAVDILKNIL